jgi:HEAT repeat protein
LAKVGRNLDAEIAEGRRCAAEIDAQLRRRLDVLYPYLKDPEPEIRRSVAAAIGHFPDIVPRLLPDLQEALKDETDKYAREALQKVVDSVSNTK